MQLVMSTRESDAERSKVKLAKGENSQSRLLLRARFASWFWKPIWS
jgi:hypothetical protein